MGKPNRQRPRNHQRSTRCGGYPITASSADALADTNAITGLYQNTANPQIIYYSLGKHDYVVCELRPIQCGT
jgi:hypothetical protein